MEQEIIQLAVDHFRHQTQQVIDRFLHDWSNLANRSIGMAEFSFTEQERNLALTLIDTAADFGNALDKEFTVEA